MVVERLKKYMDFKHIKTYVFEQSVGMSNASLGKALKSGGSIGSDKLENILKVYPDINAEWLLTGEGSMTKQEEVAADDSHTVNSLIQMIREKDTQLLSQAKEIGRLETLLQRQGNDASIAGSLAPAPAV